MYQEILQLEINLPFFKYPENRVQLKTTSKTHQVYFEG